GVAACGGGDNNDTGTSGGNSANLIKSNPANKSVNLTVGSKNFTEEYILGNIYAQALQAAGYTVKTNLNLGSEVIAYKALHNGEADASILFTSDAQLSANPDKYVLLQDDKHIFPAGNVIWVTDQSTVQKAGPDYMATLVKVLKGLTLPVIQELNARVDVDKQDPAAVATQYLKEDGYIQ